MARNKQSTGNAAPSILTDAELAKLATAGQQAATAELTSTETSGALNTAMQNWYMTVSELAIAHPQWDATAPSVMAARYGNRWNTFEATTQRSRKTEQNNVAKFSRLLNSIADVRTVAEAAKGKDNFKAVFLRACTTARKAAEAKRPMTVDAIVATITAKAVRAVANEGDLWERFIDIGNAIMKDHMARVAADKQWAQAMVTIEAKYREARAANELRTTKELADNKTVTADDWRSQLKAAAAAGNA